MKVLTGLVLFILLVTLLSGCSRFRKQNPLNVQCPSCGYIWDRSPTKGY
jgi:hypothetical protein